MENVHRKLVPDPFFILLNDQNSHCMQELLSKDILKGNNQKYFNPVPFNSQSYQKQKEPRTSDQLLFKLRNKFTNSQKTVIYYLTNLMV